MGWSKSFEQSSNFFAKLLYHGVINGQEQRLRFKRIWNYAHRFGNSSIIPAGMVTVICPECVIIRIQRCIGKPGQHMAMCKPNRAEGIQREYCCQQKEQVHCGQFCGIRKIFTKVSIQSIQNGVFQV